MLRKEGSGVSTFPMLRDFGHSHLHQWCCKLWAFMHRDPGALSEQAACSDQSYVYQADERQEPYKQLHAERVPAKCHVHEAIDVLWWPTSYACKLPPAPIRLTILTNADVLPANIRSCPGPSARALTAPPFPYYVCLPSLLLFPLTTRQTD